jgi:hypothetical protein
MNRLLKAVFKRMRPLYDHGQVSKRFAAGFSSLKRCATVQAERVSEPNRGMRDCWRWVPNADVHVAILRFCSVYRRDAVLEHSFVPFERLRELRRARAM